MKLKRKGMPLIIVGALLLVAAAGLSVYNITQSNQAFEAAATVTDRLVPAIELNKAEAEPLTDSTVPEYVAYPEKSMPTVLVDGESYIGYVEIPELKLVLPVAGAEYSYDRLAKTPCIFEGSVYQDNMVIAGHNYASHFGRINTLKPGAEVRFVDAQGNVFLYCVDSAEIIEPYDYEAMVQTDHWDLTLFTCTFGGQQRYTVRCVKALSQNG